HAGLLLQRVRRLAVPGAVEAPLGDVRRRLLRAVPVGPVRLRLAADAAGDPGQPTGLRGAVRLRAPDAVQLQPVPEAGRLLPAGRLAGGPRPAAAGPGRLPGPAPPPALGGPAAGAPSSGPGPPGLRPGELGVLAGLPRPDARGAGPVPGNAVGRG